MQLSAAQKDAVTAVDRMMPNLSSWCSTIFDFGETAWREYRSSEWYFKRLKEEGFSVEKGSGGMPTAFCADWKNGEGPTIGMYAEYDAVPGNCQAAATKRQPRSGYNFQAGGHTDPHSALGIGSLGGLLATKKIMEEKGIKGGLRFTGEPAEKVRGSKPIHAAKGYYDGLDAILSFHPFYMLPLCNTVRLNTHCGAAYSVIYRFICDEPENWHGNTREPINQSHLGVRAPGATDALVILYQSSRFLRDSMLPHQGGWSISEAILASGQATADNLPASLAEIQFMVRTPDLSMAENVVSILDRNAQSAADMTGCRMEKHWVSKSRPGLENHVMCQLVWETLQEVGPPIWDETACQVGNQILSTLGMKKTTEPFINEISRLISPSDAENILREKLPPSQGHSTSDDYTEMCWHAPTARFYIARPTLRGGPYPSWVMNALGGIPETINPTISVAAKVMAASALRIFEDDFSRNAAMQEFKSRTSGEKMLSPLCDYEPPIDFNWPEFLSVDIEKKSN